MQHTHNRILYGKPTTHANTHTLPHTRAHTHHGRYQKDLLRVRERAKAFAEAFATLPCTHPPRPLSTPFAYFGDGSACGNPHERALARFARQRNCTSGLGNAALGNSHPRILLFERVRERAGTVIARAPTAIANKCSLADKRIS